MAKSIWKDAQHHQSLRKCKAKPQWDPHFTPSLGRLPWQNWKTSVSDKWEVHKFPCALLVGMQNGVATVEGPQKRENVSQQFHFQVQTLPQIKSSIYMFKPALFTVTTTWKQFECLLTEKWMKKNGPKDFPGGPVAKTLHSQSWGPTFHPTCRN